MIQVGDFIDRWQLCFPEFEREKPWHVQAMLDQYLARHTDSSKIYIDPSATVEVGAVIKPPCWIGPDCFVASSAYLRGGIWMERGAIIGPGCEAKTLMMFEGSKLAHLSFAGDSIIGARSNIEGGAIIANYRNEMADSEIIIKKNDQIIRTQVEKFGALLGDDVRLGANSVVAPGALIDKGQVVRRLELIDQRPELME
ncbi:MAG: transferase [Parasphingorhabdus sp.]